MKSNFEVQVHENGVVVIPNCFSGGSKVFDENHIEDALNEMYRHCVNDWENAAVVKIVEV